MSESIVIPLKKSSFVNKKYRLAGGTADKCLSCKASIVLL